MSLFSKESELKKIFAQFFPDIRRVIFFSFFINILVLTPSWFMFEVYDRVVSSYGYATLFFLLIITVFIYALMQMLEWVRSKVMSQLGMRLDSVLNERVFDGIFKAKLSQRSDAGIQIFNELKNLQDAMSSPLVFGIIDAPLSLLILIALFYIDSVLGWLSVVIALVMGIIVLCNRYFIHPPLTLANNHANTAQNYASNIIKNAQVIESMGMVQHIYQKWFTKQQKYLALQSLASDRAGTSMSISKFLQTIQSSLLIGVATWLLLGEKFTGGVSMILVASIVGGRVSAPLAQIVSHWRTLITGYDAIAKLDNFLEKFPIRGESMKLPNPIGNISVEGVMATAPGSQMTIIKGLSFKIAAGKSLAIIGPSASGKSTLARLITGVWPTSIGKVRIDGADIFDWKKEDLGPFVGYLPQEIELFDGTIGENIARFGELDVIKIEEALQLVGLKDFVSSLEKGIHSMIGDEGAYLSGGQRQRIALARAIYGKPRFVVLDEPNSSLDQAGDLALSNTLKWLKQQKSTVIVITHRPQILSELDEVMILIDGQIKALGPLDKIMPNSTKPKQIVSNEANNGK